MNRTRKALAIATILGVALTLSACSTGGMDPNMDMGDSSPSNSAESAVGFNTADVSFATQMSIHHSEAVEMAQLMLDKPDIDPRVSALAQQIKDAQAPEIEQLNMWMTEWGAGEMIGMDMGGGTMSDGDMSALSAAVGVEASRLFLQQMIVHHEGAIAMAQIQLAGGEHAGALAMAQQIIDAQTA
ncbi:MAG: DUF305 domain-containing protein [Rhodoglobus sp.]|nr:DUF305 domain-containing protein [Rhodoglobus sp.]